MTLYHFTSRYHWKVIERAAVILPGDSNLSPVDPTVGPAVVWLTDTPTTDLGHGLGGSAVDKTEVRIEVDVPAIRWLDWSPAASMDQRWRDIIIKTGGGMDAAEHWWVWPAPIRASRWVDVVLREGVR